MRRLHRRFAVAACALVLVLCHVAPPQRLWRRAYLYLHPREGVHCYRLEANASAPRLMEAHAASGAIFFHETSCGAFFGGGAALSARQACAVESAARLHPNRSVYVLFASPAALRPGGRLLRALAAYGNVHLRRVDFGAYTRGTPAEGLLDRIQDGLYPQSHASDVLRYVTLWRHGGIYLDLDVVVTRSLDALGSNFAGAESENNVAAGVLGFAGEGRGHALAERCLRDLAANFNGHEWGHNGPGVITRLLRQLCGAERAKDMVGADCGGFRVVGPEFFYPVQWTDWRMYFDRAALPQVLNLTQNSYVIHVWNKHSVDTKVPLNEHSDQVPYVHFARQFCPTVIRECDHFF